MNRKIAICNFMSNEVATKRMSQVYNSLYELLKPSNAILEKLEKRRKGRQPPNCYFQLKWEIKGQTIIGTAEQKSEKFALSEAIKSMCSNIQEKGFLKDSEETLKQKQFAALQKYLRKTKVKVTDVCNCGQRSKSKCRLETKEMHKIWKRILSNSPDSHYQTLHLLDKFPPGCLQHNIKDGEHWKVHHSTFKKLVALCSLHSTNAIPALKRLESNVSIQTTKKAPIDAASHLKRGILQLGYEQLLSIRDTFSQFDVHNAVKLYGCVFDGTSHEMAFYLHDVEAECNIGDLFVLRADDRLRADTVAKAMELHGTCFDYSDVNISSDPNELCIDLSTIRCLSCDTKFSVWTQYLIRDTIISCPHCKMRSTPTHKVDTALYRFARKEQSWLGMLTALRRQGTVRQLRMKLYQMSDFAREGATQASIGRSNEIGCNQFTDVTSMWCLRVPLIQTVYERQLAALVALCKPNNNVCHTSLKSFMTAPPNINDRNASLYVYSDERNMLDEASYSNREAGDEALLSADEPAMMDEKLFGDPTFESHTFGNLTNTQNYIIQSIKNENKCMWRIQGPPGTGKTKIAACIVAQWVLDDQDKSPIFVGAGTHAAVMRLRKEINKMGLHTEPLPSRKGNRQKQIKEVDNTKKKVPIFVDTVFQACNRPSSLSLERVLIDESSQISENSGLIAVAQGCQKLVLLGDPAQLQPFSKIPLEWRKKHGPLSMFEKAECYFKNERSYFLSTQFRMPELVCRFPSNEFYGGNLKTANIRSSDALPFGFPWVKSATGVEPLPLLFIDMSTQSLCEDTSDKAYEPKQLLGGDIEDAAWEAAQEHLYDILIDGRELSMVDTMYSQASDELYSHFYEATSDAHKHDEIPQMSTLSTATLLGDRELQKLNDVTAGDNMVRGFPDDSHFISELDIPSEYVDSTCTPYYELTTKTSIQNPIEAEATMCILNGLLNAGVTKEKITIITPYASHKQLLTKLIHNVHPNGAADKDFVHKSLSISEGTLNPHIFTIDGSQGYENDFIILTTVRSNLQNSVGFLNDRNRMNVALTRSKKALIVVGDSRTLLSNPLWKKWITFVNRMGARKPFNSHSLQSLMSDLVIVLNQNKWSNGYLNSTDDTSAIVSSF